MKELYFLFNKLTGKDTKHIYYDLGISGGIEVDENNIKDIILKSNTFIDRVMLLTAILDEEIDSKILSQIYNENKETFKLIKILSKINLKLLERIEESETGWSYGIENSPYEREIKLQFQKAKNEFSNF